MTSDPNPSPVTRYEAHPPSTGEQPERSPAEIEAEIERTRMRLAGTVDAIAERVKPANVARRTADSARAQVMDEHGQLRTTRAAAIAGAAVALAALILWRRRR
jgi:uncharacterized protein with ATP-grasp and redox domains